MPEFRLRLQAKAGLTGYAQVYGKYNTTPYDKLLMDLTYISRPSLLEDMMIMFATVKILFMPESTEGVEEGQITAMQDTSAAGLIKQKKMSSKIMKSRSLIISDMYPFYWTSSERGIFMRYTYEFKKKAVELYRQGKWIDAPNDIINLKNFHDMIVRWHHLEESNTSDCLKHYGTNKKWSPEEKYELVARVIAGDTITSVAYTVGINSGLLAQWIRKYKIWGYNGLVGRRKGRKPKESAMKKMNINNPRKLNESEYEELIRLRAEITYIKAENEAIKKEIALREEREAALLKAKKQQSSKNSKKKDIC